MGHGFGFPHSSGPANNPTGNPYNSQWDVMSAANNTCVQNLVGFGCVSTNTIAYNLNNAGWIPVSRKVTVATGDSQVVTLDRTNVPTTATNPLVVIIPFGVNQYYTVEVRGDNDYDLGVPTKAVIINEVDLVNHGSEPAHIVDADTTNTNINDAGAQWQVGETFTDVTNNIQIAVVSETSTTYTVRVTNNPNPPTNDASDSATVVTPQNLIFTDTVDNTFATVSGDPSYACASVINTIWYEFTAPVNVHLNVSAIGATGNVNDVAVHVFDASFNPIACNDDSDAPASNIVFEASSDTTYLISIGSKTLADIGDITTTLSMAYDLNFDGLVAPVDAVQLINRISSVYSLQLDMDSDGQLTTDDVILLVQGFGEMLP